MVRQSRRAPPVATLLPSSGHTGDVDGGRRSHCVPCAGTTSEGKTFMPIADVSRDNTNLAKERPGSGGQKRVVSEVIDQIKNVADMMRDKNNIIIGTNYRLDAKKMASAEANGICAGDYKLDIQTVTRQKSLSRTVAVAYLDPETPNTSLQDLKDALNNSLTTAVIQRVS
jgi:hypothetical protein